MKKTILVLASTLALLLAAYGLTKITSVQIVNSHIDSTPIGSTTPSTGAFTTATATTFTGNLSGNATTASSIVGLKIFTTGATCQTTASGSVTCTGSFSVPGSPYTSSATWNIICNGIGGTGFPIFIDAGTPTSGSAFSYTIGNGPSSSAQVSGYAHLSCVAFGT